MYIQKIWGETISMKKCALVISAALMVLLFVCSVSAADADDANLTETSLDSDILSERGEDALSASENEEVLSQANTTQKASFGKVSKENYIVKDTFDVSLLGENGTALANESVYIAVNKKAYKVITDENGVAKLPINLRNGYYTINYNFNETGFVTIQGSKKILVLSKPVSAVKATKTVNGYAGVKKAFKVTLTADGVPLSGRNVVFTINKHTYTQKTNSKGITTFYIYMAKGTYTIKYSYAGEQNIKASKGSSKIKLKLLKNPYKTKYRTVLIDADGGFTKAFLNDVAKKLRKAGWKVIVKGIGPDQHSINYKNVKNAVYMPFYNGLCAATIEEMTYGYYGGLIKSHGSVITPAWYTDDWVSEKMSKFRNDITKFGYLKRAWDDNFSPSGYKGMNNPAKFMTDHGIRYCIGDTTYKIVQQFLRGGWNAYH